MVGEGDDLVQPEDPRRAFDRVRAAEQGIKQFAVGRVFLQLQQQLLKGFDLFLGLADKRGQGFGDEAVVIGIAAHAAAPAISATSPDRSHNAPTPRAVHASTSG